VPRRAGKLIELTNAQCELIAPPLPMPSGSLRIPRRFAYQMLNAPFWINQADCCRERAAGALR